MFYSLNIDSHLRNSVSQAILQLKEENALQLLQNKWMVDECVMDNPRIQVEFFHLAPPIMALATGICIAVIFAALERFYYLRRKRRGFFRVSFRKSHGKIKNNEKEKMEVLQHLYRNFRLPPPRTEMGKFQ